MHKRNAAYLLFLSVFFSASCHRPKQVEASFYYWKTVYQTTAGEKAYLKAVQAKKVYVRIMDIGMDTMTGHLHPLSPITFKSHIPENLELVPVVFIVNEALKHPSKEDLDGLSAHLLHFVDGKVSQAGKRGFRELQIDCDWTETSRDTYFAILRSIGSVLLKRHQILSVTLRLHQIKNQKKSGVPPADRVMLMCYNMGNLRKYGSRNSIIDLPELKKYIGSNLNEYRLPVDIGLPLFSWAVAFRNKQYIGIAKRVGYKDLNDTSLFSISSESMFEAKKDLPSLGLKRNDQIRWENSPLETLKGTSRFLSSYIKTDSLNLIYFHLDDTVLTSYTYENLKEIQNLLP